MGNSWDCKWDHCAKNLRNIFEGSGWYRKSVPLPADWQGMRIWLKIGGVRSQGCFWVNNRPVAWVDTYCGTYKYDITDLARRHAAVVWRKSTAQTQPQRPVQFHPPLRRPLTRRRFEATPTRGSDDAWVRGDATCRRLRSTQQSRSRRLRAG
jgi:hypothetical protein